MDKPHRTAEALLDARSAVWGYLDDLLREIPAENPAETPRTPRRAETVSRREGPAPAPEQPPRRAETPAGATPSSRSSRGDEVHLRREDAVSTPGQTSRPIGARVALPQASPIAETDPPVTEAAASGERIPDWAAQDFQALLFHVGRLSLAVPLIKLHSVIPWTDGISALPNQPEWCHGALRYRDRNMVVIDTARLVLPADRQDELTDDEAEKAHILVVGDGRWGLACRTVGEVIRLRPDEVKWRGAGSQRPWLAGTVLGRLCALMDTGAFADMLTRQGVRRG